MTSSNSTLNRHGGRSTAITTHRISNAWPIVMPGFVSGGAGNV
jgi:hypothetical protein